MPESSCSSPRPSGPRRQHRATRPLRYPCSDHAYGPLSLGQGILVFLTRLPRSRCKCISASIVDSSSSTPDVHLPLWNSLGVASWCLKCEMLCFIMSYMPVVRETIIRPKARTHQYASKVETIERSSEVTFSTCMPTCLSHWPALFNHTTSRYILAITDASIQIGSQEAKYLLGKRPLTELNPEADLRSGPFVPWPIEPVSMPSHAVQIGSRADTAEAACARSQPQQRDSIHMHRSEHVLLMELE